MNETASSYRGAQPARENGEGAPVAPPDPTGSSVAPAAGLATGSSAQRAVSPDQPTVVSKQAPAHGSPAVSDTAFRILQGKITAGDHLGHFELVEYIGGGGMGRVFRAHDSRLARDVALKILPPDQAADEETRMRFQNEAQSAARLDHENIARVFYVGEDRGLQYIVFEYIEGENIRDLVDRVGPLPLGDAISFTLQVAEALAHAAERAVVHRDIKPSNVLITPEGHVKLIDMGLARLRQVDAAVDLTASGVTLGTFDYISPEQARDPRHADVRSDIYSLGCTFFYMLTGRPPFPNGTVLQKLLQHQADQPPDVRALRADLPDELVRIVRKMLAKDPRHRYQTPLPLVNDLVHLAQRLGLQPSGAGNRMWVGTPQIRLPLWRRHLPWLIPVVALLVAVFVLDMLWSLDGHQPAIEPVAPSLPSARDGLAPPAEPAIDASRPSLLNPIANDAVARAGSAQPARPTHHPLLTEPRSPARSGDDISPRTTAFPMNPITDWSATHGGTPIGAPLPPGLVAGVEEQTTALHTSAGAMGRDRDPVGAAADSPRRNRLLVVDGQGGASGQFASLATACEAAVDGDVIELRYNGPREERPLQLGNLRLTIRAAAGFEPTVAFRPTVVDDAHAMLSFSAGRLTVIDVDFQLHVDREPAVDRWSLVELGGVQSVRFERCWITVVVPAETSGTGPGEVAVFSTRAAPAGPGAPAAGSPTRLELVDAVVRGECVLLRVGRPLPIQLTWQNGLFASGEPLVAVYGQASPSTATAGADTVAVELRHLTALARGGLYRAIETLSRPHTPTVELRCTDSVVVGSQLRPLVEHIGFADVALARQKFSYTGDGNLYDGYEVFWTVRAGANGSTTERSLGFADWGALWGDDRENSRYEPVRWVQRPDPWRAAHLVMPAELMLDDAADGLGAASDGRTPGVDLLRLPPPPALTADSLDG